VSNRNTEPPQGQARRILASGRVLVKELMSGFAPGQARVCRDVHVALWLPVASLIAD
jgi:hypothetical protein